MMPLVGLGGLELHHRMKPFEVLKHLVFDFKEVHTHTFLEASSINVTKYLLSSRVSTSMGPNTLEYTIFDILSLSFEVLD